MKLIPAPGSAEMQAAISRHYVRTISTILFQIIDEDFFKVVTLFLRHNDQGSSPEFATKLQALRVLKQGRPDAKGNFVTPYYIDELIESITILYQQQQRRVGFERGAIVELVASKLIDYRCGSDECMNNHRFQDGRFETDQVDVAVLSESRQQIEAYTCKIQPMGIMSEDCTNLTTLADKAKLSDYNINIGAISFDHSHIIARRVKNRLEDIPFSEPIKAYGVDNMKDLKKSPF